MYIIIAIAVLFGLMGFAIGLAFGIGLWADFMEKENNDKR